MNQPAGGSSTPGTPGGIIRETSTGIDNPDQLEEKFVKESQVQMLVHASDTFNLLVAITLGLLAAAAAAGIALGAGAVHPLVIYLILAACGSCGVFSGFMAFQENKVVDRTRTKLAEGTYSYYYPSPFNQLNLSAGANVSPSVTLGQSPSVTPGQLAQLDPSASNATTGADVAVQADPAGSETVEYSDERREPAAGVEAEPPGSVPDAPK